MWTYTQNYGTLYSYATVSWEAFEKQCVCYKRKRSCHLRLFYKQDVLWALFPATLYLTVHVIIINVLEKLISICSCFNLLQMCLINVDPLNLYNFYVIICKRVQLNVTIYRFILAIKKLYIFRAFLAHPQEWISCTFSSWYNKL
jgi:hypothetical protein